MKSNLSLLKLNIISKKNSKFIQLLKINSLKYKLIFLIIFKNSIDNCFFQKIFNLNFNRNVNYFQKLFNLKYFNVNYIKKYKKFFPEQSLFTKNETFSKTKKIIDKKKFRCLNISKKIRRFLFLIPFFQIKVRLILFTDFKYNIQKKPDFLIFLNLKFLYDNSSFVSDFINKKINQHNILFRTSSVNFIYLLLNKIADNNLNNNLKLNSVHKNLIKNDFLLKKTLSTPKNYIDCIFINLNHFLFQLYTKIKLITKHINCKYNFFWFCHNNCILKYKECFFIFWNFNLSKKTEFKLKKIFKIHKKINFIRYFCKLKFLDEFGINYLNKKKLKKPINIGFFSNFIIWGDPCIN